MKRTSFISKHCFTLGLVSIVFLSAFLRLYHLDTLPSSPYWEEVALGYDAYSLLKTGKDHHGTVFPVLAFESFGDWKPSLYFYAAAPSIAVFGLNVWAVRLPSALAGIGIVVGMYFLPQLLLRLNAGKNTVSHTTGKQIGLIAACIMAIEPWAITFSRAAWEVNMATFLILWGVVFLLKSMLVERKAIMWQLASVLAFGLSLYCYHAARLIAPLLLLLLMCWAVWRSRLDQPSLKSTVTTIMASGLFFLVLIAPLLLSILSPQVSSRFATENVFSNIHIIERSNDLKELAGQSLLSRIQFHRYVLFAREIAKNFSTYLNPDFLFISGDTNMRHSVGYFSVLYPLDVVFLLIGIAYLWKKQKSILLFLAVWILVGLLPAAISQPNPHALRALPTLPAWILCISFGVYGSLRLSKRFKRSWLPKIILVSICCIYLLQLVAFGLYYQTVYVKRAASWWVYGYEQLYESLDSITRSNQYTTVPTYIARSQGRPAMYDWFYHQTDPKLVQNENQTAAKDQSEFLTFGNRTYFRDLSEITDRPAIAALDQTQWTQAQTQFAPDSLRLMNTVKSLDGSDLWYIVRITK